MRMTYERPIMQAEQYVSNAYCGACTDNPVLNTDVLNVSPSNDASSWFSGVNTGNGGGRPGSGNGQWTTLPFDEDAVSGYDLDHTFLSSSRVVMTNPNSNTTQWYWTCNCESHSDGSATGSYYLEYTSHWSGELGSDTFILYKEDTHNHVLDIASGATLPNGGGNSDIAVVGVTYTHPVVADS